MNFQGLSQPQKEALLQSLRSEYKQMQSRSLKLDMSRGKPGADQLDLSMGLLDANLIMQNVKSENGFDGRNYGLLDGIPECKAIFAQLLDVPSENLIVMGNSSLNIMYDYLAHCMTHGVGYGAWSRLPCVKFACPVPGYDRHFAILEHFGIEMISVPMLKNGPDLDVLRELVQDECVKGMLCVPKYSNPEGITYSDEVVRGIAALKPAAKDFRIIWDNAYCVHELSDMPDVLLNIFTACAEFGSEDYIIEVASTSKITFPGAGVSVMAASKNTIADFKKQLFVQTIGHDKLNQLRHARYFKDANGVKAHMELHKKILAPKFEAVLSALDAKLGGTGIASWNKPNGGYFISLDVQEGCAKRVGQLCAQAGVVLTPPGATYPYGKDPLDRNIRIAPTFPPVAELELAMELLCLCIQIAALEKMLN